MRWRPQVTSRMPSKSIGVRWRANPSSRELMQRIDEMLTEQGAPAERLALYSSMLERETDPVRRRELLQRLALLHRRELNDPAAAIAIWRRAVAEEPRDLVLHQSLVDALSEASDTAAVYEELARVLPQLDPERRNVTLLRLAEVASVRKDSVRALEHYRELVQGSDLSDDVSETIEQLAREQNDGKTVQAVLERRLAHTSEPNCALICWSASVTPWLGSWRIRAKPRAFGWKADGSVRVFRTTGLAPSACSRACWMRSRTIVKRLSDWSSWPRAPATSMPYRVRSRCCCGAGEERELVASLLGLEERAVQTGNGKAFVALADSALARSLQPARARQVQLAQARALARDPERADSAAEVFRKLLAGSAGEGSADAEAFAAFLSHAERSPKRIDDYRWLFRHRLEHASDPAGVLIEWAHAEETLFDSSKAARKLYREVLERDPERTDALSELARLQAAAGDAKGALESLDSLVTRVEPEAKSAVELRRATLLIGSLSRAKEALALVEPILAVNPSDAEALRVVHHALSVPDSRAQAAAILERVAEGSEDPSARADVIEALLAVSNDAPELAAARSRWLMQLLETKTDVPEEALRLALRGAEAAPGEEQLWSSRSKWRAAWINLGRSPRRTRAQSSASCLLKLPIRWGARWSNSTKSGSTIRNGWCTSWSVSPRSVRLRNGRSIG